MRVVADTNVLVSAFVSGGKPRRFLIECARGRFQLVLSWPILHEFVEVLNRPKFDLDAEWIDRSLFIVAQLAHLVDAPPTHRVVIEDPEDDRIIDTAWHGRAEILVTGDKHLLRLGRFRGIRIMPVSSFLELIDRKEDV